MTFAQQLYASAARGVEPQRSGISQTPQQWQQTTSMRGERQGIASPSPSPSPSLGTNAANPAGSLEFDDIPPPPSFREEHDIRSVRAMSRGTPEGGPAPNPESAAYAKQSERFAQLQGQLPAYASTPGASASASGPSSRSVHQHTPPPPEWDGQPGSGLASANMARGSSLHRQPTLPLYSPVADERLSYAFSEDGAEGLEGASVSGSVEERQQQQNQNRVVLTLAGRGFADSVPDADYTPADPPPAFSTTPTSSAGSAGSGLGGGQSRRPLPALTSNVTATATAMATSGNASAVPGRRVSGPRTRTLVPAGAPASIPSPVVNPHTSAPALASRASPPVSVRTTGHARPPSSISTHSSVGGSESAGPTTATTAAQSQSQSQSSAYGRSLYASAVASAAHPQPVQRASTFTAATTNAAAASGNGSVNVSVVGRPASASSPVVSPAPRPAPSSVPLTQVQHLQLQPQGQVGLNPTSALNAGVTGPPPPPPPLPRRGSSADDPSVVVVQGQSVQALGTSPTQIQMRMQAQTGQGQARPYRYSTSVVPPSSSSYPSAAAASFSSSSSLAVAGGAQKEKKKGGFFGMSREKHREVKRLEAEARERERAARERAERERVAQMQAQMQAQVHAQLTGTPQSAVFPPPPLPPLKTQEQQQVPTNPYVAAAQALSQAQAQGLQTVGQQRAQVAQSPQNQQQYLNVNNGVANALSVIGIRSGVAGANALRNVSAVFGSAVSSVGQSVGQSVANVLGDKSNGNGGNGSGGQSIVAPALLGGVAGLVGAAALNQLASENGIDLSGVDLSSLLTDGGDGPTIDLSGLANSLDLSQLTDGVDFSQLTSGMNVDLSGVDLGAFTDSVDPSAYNLDLGQGVDFGGVDNAEGFDLSAPYADDSMADVDVNSFYNSDGLGLEGFGDGSGSGSGNGDGEMDASMPSFEDISFYDSENAEVDPTYEGEPTDGTGESASWVDSGLGYDDAYMDYADPQFSQDGQVDGEGQDENEQVDQTWQDTDEQQQDTYEKQQDAQQEQYEKLQNTLEEQEKHEQQLQHQQQQELVNLQHRMEMQAQQEQHAQQQLLHHQLQQQHQHQQQMQALRLQMQQQAQAQVALQRQEFAKLQARMQAQAKLQAQYIARLQVQQRKMQQFLQAQIQNQRVRNQAQEVVLLLEAIQKMHEGQVQVVAQLARVQLGAGNGNVGGMGAVVPNKPATGGASAARPPARPQIGTSRPTNLQNAAGAAPHAHTAHAGSAQAVASSANRPQAPNARPGQAGNWRPKPTQASNVTHGRLGAGTVHNVPQKAQAIHGRAQAPVGARPTHRTGGGPNQSPAQRSNYQAAGVPPSANTNPPQAAQVVAVGTTQGSANQVGQSTETNSPGQQQGQGESSLDTAEATQVMMMQHLSRMQQIQNRAQSTSQLQHALNSNTITY